MWMVARTFTRRLQRTWSCRFYCSPRPMQEKTTGNDLSSHVYVTSDFCDHRGMQLCFLGTSSSIPTLRRNTSCLALRLDGVVYLFDCGEGAQKQLNRTTFRPSSIENIFITHMHGDHVSWSKFDHIESREIGIHKAYEIKELICFALTIDFPFYVDIWTSRFVLSRLCSFKKPWIFYLYGSAPHSPGLLSGIGMTGNKSQPINIYGPEGLRTWIRTTLNSCHGRVPSKYAVHELKVGKKPGKKLKQAEEVDMHQDEYFGQDIFSSSDSLWHLVEDKKYIVKAGLLRHSIPCWGFIVEEHTRPGRFSVERARKLGVQPGHDYALLQQGHSITLKDGQKITPLAVLGHPRRGRKIVILGDTYDSSSLLSAAEGADILVHECTILEQDACEAVKRFHSTATMAGKFAKAIGTRCLVLTHFSCKYEARPDRVEASVKAAQIAFGSEKVVAAKDLLAVTVCQTDEPA